MTDDERDDRAMDFLYGYVRDLVIQGKFSVIDTFLDEIDPLELSATVIVAVLVSTRLISDRLDRRVAFIERGLPVLELEPEGLDAVLQGLR